MTSNLYSSLATPPRRMSLVDALALLGGGKGDPPLLPRLLGAEPVQQLAGNSLPGSTPPSSPGPVQEYSARMAPGDTSSGPIARAAGNPFAASPGLLGGIFGADSGIGRWSAEHRGALRGLGAAFLGDGMDFSSVTRGAEQDDQRRLLASEWDRGQQGKNSLLTSLEKYGPEFADIAEGLRGGYLDPNTAFSEMAKRKSQLAEQAQLDAKNKGNATFIKDPELRAAVEAGALSFSDAYEMDRGKKQSLMNVGDGTVYDPNTNEWLTNPNGDASAPDLKEIFGFEKDLYAQYANSDPAKTYEAVKGGYERVRESAQQQSGAGDMAMLYGYMRMLDPGSVVRESEFAMAAQAGDFGEQVQGMVSRLLNGQRLPESQRQEFLQNAEKLYGASAQNLSDINNQFSERAAGYGVDPSRFIRQPEAFPTAGQPPQIGTEQQYQALPPGSQYVAPDGTIRTKP